MINDSLYLLNLQGYHNSHFGICQRIYVADDCPEITENRDRLREQIKPLFDAEGDIKFHSVVLEVFTYESTIAG